MTIKIINGKRCIYDPIRRRYVKFTPEEAVRQTYIQHLIVNLGVPPIAISVEKKLMYNRQMRRYDIVVYCREKCWMVVECKADTVEITEEVLQQAALYNSILQAEYIVLFNGKTEFILQHDGEKYTQCQENEKDKWNRTH